MHVSPGSRGGRSARTVARQQFRTRPNQAYLEDFGAVGNNLFRDTEALRRAMAIPDMHVWGLPGRDYYVRKGVAPAAGGFVHDARFKVRIGSEGFDSVDIGSIDRYALDHCLFHWNGVDGGGLENVEVFADTTATHRHFIAAAVTGGMSTRPFVIRGRFMVRDISGQIAGVIFNGIGVAGYDIDTMEFRNLGTTVAIGSWLNNGATATGFTQTQGFALDDSGVSNRGRISRIIGKNYIRSRTHQTDHVTLAGQNAANDKGPYIAYIYCDGVEEVVDMFCSGAEIGVIVGKNVYHAVLKLAHGAQFNTIGEVRGVGAIGMALVKIEPGDGSPPGATQYNEVKSVVGYGVGEFIDNFGTLVSATATTAVLAVGASAEDDAYFSSGVSFAIEITSGTGSSATEVPITDYVGATRTITVASWPSGTPNATSTYKIRPFGSTNRAAVIISGGVGAMDPKGNHITVNGVLNDGHMDYIAANSDNDAGVDNNQVVIERDFGFLISSTAASGGAIYWARAGAGAKAVTRLGIASSQAVATTSDTPVNFNTLRECSYRRTGSAGLQSSIGDLGIRVLLPGPKRFHVHLGYSVSVADEYVIANLKRNGVVIARSIVTPATSGTEFSVNDLTFDVYHKEDQFGANLNLYTVSVQHETATSRTIDAGESWFSVEG